jgi:hypothetical protein
MIGSLVRAGGVRPSATSSSRTASRSSSPAILLHAGSSACSAMRSTMEAPLWTTLARVRANEVGR